MDKSKRITALKAALAQRILVLDGAMGTAIQSFDLGPDDFGGPEYEGCNEYLVVTRPDVIESIHQGHLDAGADIIETDTFGAMPIVLSEYSLAHEARRLNREAAVIALKAADAAATPEKPRFVAGSMGPTTKTISVTGGVTFEELADTHAEFVEDYEELAPEASRIFYANGTAFAVNWGDTPVGDLEPLGYRIDSG